jgi:hypothetical protein
MLPPRGRRRIVTRFLSARAPADGRRVATIVGTAGGEGAPHHDRSRLCLSPGGRCRYAGLCRCAPVTRTSSTTCWQGPRMREGDLRQTRALGVIRSDRTAAAPVSARDSSMSCCRGASGAPSKHDAALHRFLIRKKPYYCLTGHFRSRRKVSLVTRHPPPMVKSATRKIPSGVSRNHFRVAGEIGESTRRLRSFLLLLWSETAG